MDPKMVLRNIGQDEALHKCRLWLIEDPALELNPGSMWRCSRGERWWLHSAFTLSLCSSIVGAKDTHCPRPLCSWGCASGFLVGAVVSPM